MWEDFPWLWGQRSTSQSKYDQKHQTLFLVQQGPFPRGPPAQSNSRGIAWASLECIRERSYFHTFLLLYDKCGGGKYTQNDPRQADALTSTSCVCTYPGRWALSRSQDSVPYAHNYRGALGLKSYWKQGPISDRSHNYCGVIIFAINSVKMGFIFLNIRYKSKS